MGNRADLIKMTVSKVVFARERFISLVRKSWNAVANSVPTLCLMNYCRRTHTWRIHCQADSSFFISFPQLEDAEIRCSKYGWLLMSRSDSTLFFFNPCGNRTLNIPHRIGYGYTTIFFIHPPTSPDCTVFGIQTPVIGRFVEICMLTRRKGGWEIKEHPTKTEFSLSSGPPVLHRGKIYFLDERGNVAMFDIINRRLVTTNKCLVSRRDDKIKEHYLFKLKGEVFGVFVFHYVGKVKVFRLSTRKTKKKMKMRWELVEDIGDNVVYLSRVSSLSFGCTKIMANRIYFPRLHGDSAVFYSLSDGKFHSLNDDYTDNNAPALIKKLDHAAWVELTATELTTWKLLSHIIITVIFVCGFLTIIKKIRK